VRPLRDAEVHSDLLPVQLRVCHGVPSLGGVLDFLESNKSKTPRSAGLPVQHDGDLGDGTELAELLVQLSLGGVETQTEHSQAVVGGRLVSGALMTPPIGHRRPGVVLPPPVPTPGPRPRVPTSRPRAAPAR